MTSVESQPPATPVAPPRWPCVAGILIVLAFLIVCLWTSATRSYWQDEIATINDLRLNLPEMIVHRLKAGHLPLYFTFMWGWVRALGESEFVVRLPGAVFGAGALWFLFMLVKRLAGAPAAVASALLLTASVPLYALAQQARMYTLVPLFTVASAVVILRAEERPSRRLSVALCLLTAANLTTYFAAGLAVAPLAVYLAVRKRPRWDLLLAMGVGALAIVPWVIAHHIVAPPRGHLSWIHDPMIPPADLLWRFSLDLFFLKTMPSAHLLIRVILTAAALRGVWVLGSRGRILTFLWLGPIAVGYAMVAFGYANILGYDRYFATVIVCQAGVLGAGLCGPWPVSKPALRGVLTAAGCVAGAVLVCGACLSAYETLNKPSVDEWRRMAKLVRDHRQSDEAVVLAALTAGQWRFYWPEPSTYIRDLDFQPGAPGVAGLPLDSRGVWVIVEQRVWRDAKKPAGDSVHFNEVMARLRSAYPAEKVFDEYWGRVVHLTRTPDAPATTSAP